MVIGQNREEDLLQLENLVKREKLAGHIVHHFYYHLRSLYPLEFIYIARKYNKPSLGHQHFIEESIKKVNNAYRLLNHYLIVPPENKDETKEFEYVAGKLQQLLIKQSKEN